MWNGPKTVLSVPPSLWLSVSTSIDTPRTSDSRTNSWRVSLQVWPTSVRNWIACSHSWRDGRVSRTKVCR